MPPQPITPPYRAAVNQFLRDEWHAPPVVTRGKTHDTMTLPGFIFLDGGRSSGIVTYHIENNECELVTLNSFNERKGIGSALVRVVINAAREGGCRRVWLITTNDNTAAFRFYQKQGFNLAAAHINALSLSRKMKPSIPLTGIDGIPLRHELELELLL